MCSIDCLITWHITLTVSLLQVVPRAACTACLLDMETREHASLVKTTCNLNLIILQSTAMLRVQITHDIDTLLYFFHIRRQMPDERRETSSLLSGMFPVAIWLIRPSIEYCHLVICCCTANLNYSQLWHISLMVSWKASGSDILISRQQDNAADDQEIWVVDALLNNSWLVILGVFQMIAYNIGTFL